MASRGQGKLCRRPTNGARRPGQGVRRRAGAAGAAAVTPVPEAAELTSFEPAAPTQTLFEPVPTEAPTQEVAPTQDLSHYEQHLAAGLSVKAPWSLSDWVSLGAEVAARCQGSATKYARRRGGFTSPRGPPSPLVPTQKLRESSPTAALTSTLEPLADRADVQPTEMLQPTELLEPTMVLQPTEVVQPLDVVRTPCAKACGEPSEEHGVSPMQATLAHSVPGKRMRLSKKTTPPKEWSTNKQLTLEQTCVQLSPSFSSNPAAPPFKDTHKQIALATSVKRAGGSFSTARPDGDAVLEVQRKAAKTDAVAPVPCADEAFPAPALVSPPDSEIATSAIQVAPTQELLATQDLKATQELPRSQEAVRERTSVQPPCMQSSAAGAAPPQAAPAPATYQRTKKRNLSVTFAEQDTAPAPASPPGSEIAASAIQVAPMQDLEATQELPQSQEAVRERTQSSAPRAVPPQARAGCLRPAKRSFTELVQLGLRMQSSGCATEEVIKHIGSESGGCTTPEAAPAPATPQRMEQDNAMERDQRGQRAQRGVACSRDDAASGSGVGALVGASVPLDAEGNPGAAGNVDANGFIRGMLGLIQQYQVSHEQEPGLPELGALREVDDSQLSTILAQRISDYEASILELQQKREAVVGIMKSLQALL